MAAVSAPCGDAPWAYLRLGLPHGGTSWPWARGKAPVVARASWNAARQCIRCIRCSAERSTDHRSAAFYNPVGHMDLKRRLAKLETTATARQARTERVYSDEDLAIMQRIVNQTYADPERYASRIALFERLGATRPDVSVNE